MSFGQHLRTLRGEAGLSRAELARRSRVSVSTLRNWENDRGFLHLAACLRLAEALSVPVERLAEGVEDPIEDELTPAPASTVPEDTAASGREGQGSGGKPKRQRSK
jgi:transcriptional regulator with XRE-family HTH domain